MVRKHIKVERDRWYGSPISATGQLREPKASFYRRLHAMLDELEWTEESIDLYGAKR